MRGRQTDPDWGNPGGQWVCFFQQQDPLRVAASTETLLGAGAGAGGQGKAGVQTRGMTCRHCALFAVLWKEAVRRHPEQRGRARTDGAAGRQPTGTEARPERWAALRSTCRGACCQFRCCCLFVLISFDSKCEKLTFSGSLKIVKHVLPMT